MYDIKPALKIQIAMLQSLLSIYESKEDNSTCPGKFPSEREIRDHIFYIKKNTSPAIGLPDDISMCYDYIKEKMLKEDTFESTTH